MSYPSHLDSLARRAAAVLERARGRLEPILEWTPPSKTYVVITDGSDGANGSATALPFNTIRLNATAPGDLSAIGDYDDWLTLLITHEDTHVLHLDNITGLPRLINRILGKVWSPNSVEPRWITEGFATYLESELTSAGRMRSTYFEMHMRMEFLGHGGPLRLDQISNGVDRWPHGNVFYLYGSRFIAFIAERYGDAALAEVAHIYGRQVIPYSLNRTVNRATGKTYTELYAEWLEAEGTKQAEVLARVEREGRVEGRRLTHHGEFTHYPRFLDNERVVYSTNDGSSDSQLRAVDFADGGRPRQLARVRGAASSSVGPEGQLYYNSLTDTRDIYFQNDLFRLDAEGGRRQRRLGGERLTRGLRAKAPDVSRDGTRLAYTVESGGTSHLAIAETADLEGSERILLRSERFEQVFTPRFSPDGRTLAISRWTAGGYRDICLVDVLSGNITEVTRDRAQDTGPAWSPDGRYLYFSSDRTGVANIYRWEREGGELLQVTNVIGGAYSPDVSPDGRSMVYVGYTERGFDLRGLDLAAVGSRPASAYHDTRPLPSETSGSVVGPSARYHPGDTLLPRSWSPTFSTDAWGTRLGVSVAGADVVGFYAWHLNLDVSLATGFVHVETAWNFNRSASPMAIRAFRHVQQRGGLSIAGQAMVWDARVHGGSASISHPFRRQFFTNRISASYAISNVTPDEPLIPPLDPDTPSPIYPELGWRSTLSAGWAFSDARRRTYDMFTTAGRSLSLNLAITEPVGLDENAPAMRLSWQWRGFVEAPWVHHHAFAFRYAGGISAGPEGERGLFFVGGFPEGVLVGGDLINGIQRSGRALRGYPPFVAGGTQFHVVQSEYRFPIGRIMAGYATLPVFLRRVYADVFVDVGTAFDGSPDLRELRVGAGAEIFLDFTLGYFLELTWRNGFAYGFSEGGGATFYSHLGVPF